MNHRTYTAITRDYPWEELLSDEDVKELVSVVLNPIGSLLMN